MWRIDEIKFFDEWTDDDWQNLMQHDPELMMDMAQNQRLDELELMRLAAIEEAEERRRREAMMEKLKRECPFAD